MRVVQLTVRCGACGSDAPYRDYCQWCGKPLACTPREPTPEESVNKGTGGYRLKSTARAAQLLREIESFCQQYSIAQTRFGRMAANDPSFVTQLREGRDPRAERCTKARAFMASYVRHKA